MTQSETRTQRILIVRWAGLSSHIKRQRRHLSTQRSLKAEIHFFLETCSTSAKCGCSNVPPIFNSKLPNYCWNWESCKAKDFPHQIHFHLNRILKREKFAPIRRFFSAREILWEAQLKIGNVLILAIPIVILWSVWLDQRSQSLIIIFNTWSDDDCISLTWLDWMNLLIIIWSFSWPETTWHHLYMQTRHYWSYIL